MDIGTAKPNKTLLEKYPHHLINICNPEDTYSAFDFMRVLPLSSNTSNARVMRCESFG
jgi:tRNA A37 N6-isopentenylltransferase MiaA